MKKIILLAMMAFILSCSKDDDMQISSTLECLGNAEEPFGLSNCDNFPANDFLCDNISIGEFELEDVSKEYMVYACNSIGDQFKFENETGVELEFNLIERRYQKTTGVYNSGDVCQSDSSKTMGICLTSELIRLVLRSENPELEFRIEIKTLPDTDDEEIGGAGDLLQISRVTGLNSFVTEFNAVLSQRTLSYERTFSQEVIESVNILDEEFNAVITNDINNFIEIPFKFYYNKSEGLIAFQDKEGVMWKRK